MDLQTSTKHANDTNSVSPDVRVTNGNIFYLIITINFAIICELVAVFGTITNIINIAVFAKMGFTEQINISLFGLAISDLCSVLVLHWHNLCYNPYFKSLDLPFEPYDVQYVTGGIPHVLFSRITASLTAFITFERCMCIYLPLKVKTILNPVKVKVVVCGLYTFNFMCAAPFFYANQLGRKFFQEKNKTAVGLVFAKDRFLIDSIVFSIMNVLIPLCSFVFIVTCTLIIVRKMSQKANWKASSTSTQQSDKSVDRDQKVSRMVVMISVLFILCFTPHTIASIPLAFLPEFSILGKYKDIAITLASFNFVLESINASVNTFIYYTMSSKFREALVAVRMTMMCTHS